MSFPTLNALKILQRDIVYNPAARNRLEVKEDGVSIITQNGLGQSRPFYSHVPARPSPGRNPKFQKPGTGGPHRPPSPPRIRPPPSLMPIYSIENM